MWRTGLLLFLILSISTVVHAEEGGYIVTPHEDELVGSTHIDTGGADTTLSFLDIPLWIKIAYISGFLVGFFGFFKVIPLILGKTEHVFKNQKRKNIMKYVNGNPGCTIAEISKDLKINRGSLKYHLLILKVDNKISYLKAGKFTRVFKNNGNWEKNDKILASHLRNDTGKLLLLAILENPGMTNQGLAESFQLDKSTVHWYTEKFSNDGIIRFESEGKYKKYSVNPNFEPDILKSTSSN
jgi:predicted transcriptional regulator